MGQEAIKAPGSCPCGLSGKRSNRSVKWNSLFFTLTNDWPLSRQWTHLLLEALKTFYKKNHRRFLTKGMGANDTMSELNLCWLTLGAAIENKFCLKKGVWGHTGKIARTKAVVG